MIGDDIAEAMARAFFASIVLVFFAGIVIGVLAQWLFPIIKAWAHWSTG